MVSKMGTRAIGLPHVYKLVNLETGEEWNPLIQASKMRKNASIKNASIKNASDMLCGFSLTFPSGIYADVRGGWELRQKLTFTDTNDKPLYFGDVVIGMGKSGDVHGLAIIEWQENTVSMKHIGGQGYLSTTKWYFVGNNCEPKEKWVERFKELFPDAEFPELFEEGQGN
jgi:hypothetical protein